MIPDVRNVVLFVGDAVRYDESVGSLAGYGPTYETIAASLHTPASFASMLTGLDVPSHGVTGFQHVLSDGTPSLVDLDDLDGRTVAFSDKTGTMHEDLHRIFEHPERSTLEEMEAPFVWIVRDPGGHAPYDGYDGDTYDQIDESAGEYLGRVAGDRERIRADYRAGVDSSIGRFREAIECVERRGIAEETLLVYASDHGELLGEHGLLGHNHVACPELVYVPTTFVHPSLDPGREATGLRHVDLLPTILDALGAAFPSEGLAGASLDEESPVGRIGYNHFEMVFYDSPWLSTIETRVRSCWDGDGGHVFVDSSYLDALSVYLAVLVSSHKGKQIRHDRSYLGTGRLFLPGHTKHGDPGFGVEEARARVEAIEHPDDRAVREPLDDEARRRLDDLGYL